MQPFDPQISALEADMLSWRRHLHANPELSFEEYSTTDFVARKIEAFGGFSITRPTKTGLVASITGMLPGTPRVIGVRVDIDALPIHEENDLPFRSHKDGVMHACGHDGHTAIALAAAQLLSQNRQFFCGEVRFFFQHAEELPPGGAIELVRAGAADGVEAMLGLHLSTAYPLGVFGIRAGTLTSAVDRFDITLQGKGGHCAYPEQARDPLVAMAELVLALQTIVSRRLPPLEPAVVSVCVAEAGSAYNIIPDSAHIAASVRSFDPTTRAAIETEVRQITRSVAKAAGVEDELTYEHGYPSVVNDPGLTQLARGVIRSRFGAQRLLEIEPIMPGEDFSYFLEDRPGFFVELGSRNETNGCDQPHHNPRYRLDEDALLYGVQYLYDILREMLNAKGDTPWL